jgi:cytochrome c556
VQVTFRIGRILVKKLVCVLGSLAVMGLAGAEPAKAPSIKEVMQKLNKGAKAPMPRLKNELKTSKPNWKTIQEATSEVAVLGAALPTNSPKQGDPANYKKLAEAFASNAQALDDAAKKEELKTAQEAFGKMSNACSACHKVHRPR